MQESSPIHDVPDLDDRLIWLRRPARVIASGLAFTPARPAHEIDSAWDALVAANSRMTDGPCWHVTGVHRDGHGGATIHVTRTTYRMGAVRGCGVSTGFVGLGTKAIAHWNRKVLIGRRAHLCATYPDHWEFAPGGAVEPGEDPAAGIERELLEECAAKCCAPARAVAIFFDPHARNWEIVHELRIDSPPDSPPNWEYSQLQLSAEIALPEPAAQSSRVMLQIARRVLSEP